MNVSELIAALQEVSNGDATVTLAATVAGGAEVASVSVAGVTEVSLPADAPRAGGQSSPGTVVLDD